MLDIFPRNIRTISNNFLVCGFGIWNTVCLVLQFLFPESMYWVCKAIFSPPTWRLTWSVTIVSVGSGVFILSLWWVEALSSYLIRSTQGTTRANNTENTEGKKHNHHYSGSINQFVLKPAT